MSSDETPPIDQIGPEESQVAAVLGEIRPSPRERFQAALGQRLVLEDPGYGPRPGRLWPQSLLLITIGALLLVAGALVSVGGI